MITNHKVANGLVAGVPPRKDWEQFYKLRVARQNFDYSGWRSAGKMELAELGEANSLETR